MAKIGVQGGILDTYYRAQRDVENMAKLAASINTQKKIGNLKNNTSSDLEVNKQNAYLRQENNMDFNSKELYKSKREEAARKINANEPPTPTNNNSVSYILKDNDDDND